MTTTTQPKMTLAEQIKAVANYGGGKLSFSCPNYVIIQTPRLAPATPEVSLHGPAVRDCVRKNTAILAKDYGITL